MEFPTTNDYYSDIGTTQISDLDTNVYQIINKETGVIEFETQVLPNLYSAIKELQELLDHARKPTENDENKIRPVNFSKDD